MAGFNADLELGRIARESGAIQSKKLMWGIKGIYSRRTGSQIAGVANQLVGLVGMASDQSWGTAIEAEAHS
jgi:hypothetical protein